MLIYHDKALICTKIVPYIYKYMFYLIKMYKVQTSQWPKHNDHCQNPITEISMALVACNIKWIHYHSMVCFQVADRGDNFQICGIVVNPVCWISNYRLLTMGDPLPWELEGGIITYHCKNLSRYKMSQWASDLDVLRSNQSRDPLSIMSARMITTGVPNKSDSVTEYFPNSWLTDWHTYDY